MASSYEDHFKRVIPTFIIWILFIAVIFYVVGFDLSKILEVDLIYLAFALLAFVISLLGHLLSWYVLIGFFVKNINLFHLFRAMMIGFFVERFVPHFFPIGEFTMGYMGSKEKIADLNSSMASVTVQMFTWAIGFIAMALLILSWALLTVNPELYVWVMFTLLFTFFLALVVILLYFIIHPMKARGTFRYFCSKLIVLVKYLGFFKGQSKDKLLHGAMDSFESFAKSIRPYIGAKKRLVVSSTFMFIHHVSVAAIFFFTVMGVGLGAPVAKVMLFFIIARLVGWLTFSPGEIGTFELTSIVLLSTVAPVGLSVLTVGIYRLIQYWLSAFAGSLFAIDYKVEKISKTKPKKSKI